MQTATEHFWLAYNQISLQHDSWKEIASAVQIIFCRERVKWLWQQPGTDLKALSAIGTLISSFAGTDHYSIFTHFFFMSEKTSTRTLIPPV